MRKYFSVFLKSGSNGKMPIEKLLSDIVDFGSLSERSFYFKEDTGFYIFISK